MFKSLQHQDRRTFSHYKTVPAAVKRPAGPFGFFVAGGHGLHGTEPGHGQGCDWRFCSAGNHNIGMSPLEHLKSVTNGVAAGGTGRYTGNIRPPQAKIDGYLPRAHICYHHGYEKRADPPRTPPGQDPGLFFKGLDTADARTENNTNSVPVCGFQIQRRVLYGHTGSSHRKLSEAIHAAGLFPVNIPGRLKINNFPCNLRLKISSVKPCYRSYPRNSAGQRRPEPFQSRPYRRYYTKAGNDNPFLQSYSSLFKKVPWFPPGLEPYLTKCY
jgi:hypothetical protein